MPWKEISGRSRPCSFKEALGVWNLISGYTIPPESLRSFLNYPCIHSVSLLGLKVQQILLRDLVINNIPAPVTNFININISPLPLHLILKKNHILELQTCVQTFKSSSNHPCPIPEFSLPTDPSISSAFSLKWGLCIQVLRFWPLTFLWRVENYPLSFCAAKLPSSSWHLFDNWYWSLFPEIFLF